MPEAAPGSDDSASTGGAFRRLKAYARRLAAESYALYIASQDPRTPWYARWLAAFMVAYALSPVDLIPDFIPVIGYLDDLLFVPLGIALAIWLIPKPVWRDSRARAREIVLPGPVESRTVTIVIVSIWVGFGVLAVWLGVALSTT